jgi:hypothetical protein
MRLDLAEGCPKIAEKRISDLCGVINPGPDRPIITRRFP